jgi:hypothetical protein
MRCWIFSVCGLVLDDWIMLSPHTICFWLVLYNFVVLKSDLLNILYSFYKQIDNFMHTPFFSTWASHKWQKKTRQDGTLKMK